MREIRPTAGRLQVQISSPSASLLIKQLNGLAKVVLRVKTAKEGRHGHARTQRVPELDPELQHLSFRLIAPPFGDVFAWYSHYTSTRTHTHTY